MICVKKSMNKKTLRNNPHFLQEFTEWLLQHNLNNQLVKEQTKRRKKQAKDLVATPDDDDDQNYSSDDSEDEREMANKKRSPGSNGKSKNGNYQLKK